MVYARLVPRLAVILLALSLALAGGCAHNGRPIVAADAPDPELAPIAEAFAETVQRVRADPALVWHAGWIGNIRVNIGEGRNRGLCYHWRDAVYDGVLPLTRQLGWEATFIAVNLAMYGEHHAVLVYDVHRFGPPGPPIDDPPDTGAYVLDAWRRGKADIYPMREWLELPRKHRVPPTLLEPSEWYLGNGVE